ncbi:DUF4828 domain-containing protein [Lactiplantibacillus mudanjiangensis]|uniref:DUF4828 domain-containing protein n=1 Tax=Lactiplantibacillus mudanjiangensis TaxID=1296538 RepID=A0A660E925_9LACO|nr:DUF4828 domain-containing protein [Lactiplantibacillus mudanjiangensis]VDG17608.1 hypothetical protein MUDAN_BIHEEGNE_00125 [Lactiplantibacillus mudanjiangensis]VDG23140.1 hypothetical protein MUDAN_IGPPGNFN_01772 [Lactiplantibacillus mudanjiangensis]VDG29589.1 hypothetical protein MUDAN_MDHGFNIF_01149 [Lactiplantibacillus mudanjiangensis]VDG32702.1 hypothetical protein MUDAN_DOGOELCO_01964 [Lactiplantibacillus mudanjiangensis]
MKRRGAILFGLSLLAGLSSTFLRKKHPHQQASGDLAVFYAGTWTYRDEAHHRDHQLEIDPNMVIKIDGHAMPATVESISAEKLVLLDKYGFHLEVKANEQRPVALFDEADNRNYVILSPHLNQAAGQ